MVSDIKKELADYISALNAHAIVAMTHPLMGISYCGAFFR